METVKKESLQVLSLESEFRRTHRNLPARFINVEFADCPVEASLNTLGKKWALLIIRDIGVYGIDRLNQLLKSLPGIPSKILATRLKQLEKEGFLERKVERVIPPQEWNADKVFDDKRPRKMHEIYNREGMELLMRDF